MSTPFKVVVVGCGLIGKKRAVSLRQAGDQLVGCFDPEPDAAVALAEEFGGTVVSEVADLWKLDPDVAIVATPHCYLAQHTQNALAAGADVLVEKPAAISSTEVSRLIELAQQDGRLVKVGFNHRFHPGIERSITLARSGEFGPVMFARARYGHGGRLGYEREWRMDPTISGGGELIDQGMHMLDLGYWLFGELPLRSALLRTNFWDSEVEDNAVLTLSQDGRRDPWFSFHTSWSEWKNIFSLEIYCETAKFQVDGLTGSYGAQRLTIFRMKPELGPPEVEVEEYPEGDLSWQREWEHLRARLASRDEALLGDLQSARYAWQIVEAAYGH